MKRRPADGDVWAIVLAGGEGKRMCPFVERWLGYERPKQYCSFFGTKSLLGHTLDRASRLVGEDRVVTIIGKGHRSFLREESSLPGHILEQPEAKGTGPGVLLPLSFIHAQDPNAIVVVLPSDHFVHPEAVFFERIMEATELLDRHSDRLVLIGAIPQGPESEYGWIEPGLETACVRQDPIQAQRVRRFVEKPSSNQALHCFECGHFWSTMIVVSRASSLWSLAVRLQPQAMSRLEKLRQGLRAIRDHQFSAGAEEILMRIAYSDMPNFDFSRDILTPSVDQCLLVPLRGVTWSDLGRPERVLETLDRIGLRPNFPRELVVLPELQA